MYCKHCGSEMPDDALFCSHCGTRLEHGATEPGAVRQQEEPLAAVPQQEENLANKVILPEKKAAPAPARAEEEVARKPFLEGMKFNVSEYPDSNVIEKTEDIDFNWNTDPDKVSDHTPGRAQVKPQPKEPEQPKKSSEGIRVSEIFDRVVPAEAAKAAVEKTSSFAETSGAFPETAGSAAEIGRTAAERTERKEDAGGSEIEKFNTVKRKNEEFQQLLNKEYEKIKVAGTIGSEQSQADAIARERFDSRQDDMTMEQFLEKEGTVKLYEPKPLESDVLARIEAQEKKRAREKAEEEARAKAEAKARAEAEARRKAETARLNSEVEANAAAAEEIRLAEEEEVRRRTEEEARRKAAAQAARLEAIASRKAAEEQAALEQQQHREAEEARRKAEAEARAREEAEARARAEMQAARRAEEEARRKAEAELNAAREAARIRAQQEANIAAREEARFRQEQERRRREEEMLRQKQARQARQENAIAVQNQVRDALAQTAKMREEEEAKIRAALAGIRDGRFSSTIQSQAEAQQEAAETEPQMAETPAAPVEPVAAAPIEPVAAAPVEPVATAPEQIEEAHQATRSQIDEMARARANFFADFPDSEDLISGTNTPTDLSQTKVVSKDDLMSDIDYTKKLSRDELHVNEVGAETAAAAAFAVPAAAEAEAVPQFEAAVPQFETAAPQFETAAPEFGADASTGEGSDAQIGQMDDLLNQFATLHSQIEEQPAEPAAQVTDLPEDIASPLQTSAESFAEDMTGSAPAFAEEEVWPAPSFDEIENEIREEIPAGVPEAAQDAMYAGPGEAAPVVNEAVAEKPGLEDTMIMPMGKDQIANAQAGMEAGAYGAGLTAREKKQQAREEKRQAKEQKRAAKAAAVDDTFVNGGMEYEEDVKPKGGVGRTILMIILILLCVVFALELAGIGIKLLAPTSGAAEFIDNILNSLIHMITG